MAANSSVVKKCSECQSHVKSIFAKADSKASEQIDNTRESFSFTDGSDLYADGPKSLGVFCLQSGHVKIIYRKDPAHRTVRICGPGDVINLCEDADVETFSAVGIGTGSFCFYKRDAFFKIMQGNVDVALNFSQFMCHALRECYTQIAGLENFSIKNRIASALVFLNRKFGKQTDLGSKIDLRLERKILAQLSGTVIESVARMLTEFEDEKIIRREGRFIFITDAERLTRIANGET